MKREPFMYHPILGISILALVVGLFLPSTSHAQIKNIWALGDGEKVFRNDLDHPSKKGNYTWDGKTIRLKGLYNEVLGLQVILETAVDTAKSIELTVDLPVNKASGKAIGGNTLKYGPAGTVELFSQHYLLVKDSAYTRPKWFYGSEAASPKKMTGWIPDALIPVYAPKGQGGFPMDIGPSRNQGFWIDISLPRDQKEFPSGVYSGKVNVLQKGVKIKEIPLEITLLPNYLPDENRTNIWLHAGGIYSYYPDLTHQEVDNMLKFEGHRHRIDIPGGYQVNAPFNGETMGKYKAYLDGSAFTSANGYHGSGEGVGEKIFPVGMYGSPIMGNTREAVQKQSNLWVDWFNKNAPGISYFWYMTDEPPKERYPWVLERGRWVKENPGVGKSLPLFTTTHYQADLAEVIDVWAGYDGVNLSDLPIVRAKGGDHWFYNGNRPRYGSVILEGAAVDFRVNSWVLYKYDIRTHFIWHGTLWQHNGQGPKRHQHQNVFDNPLTFINDGMSFGNGDGILFYPGRMPYYPSEDRGINELIPSIRLKNIRRGQQDANIMWMAEKKIGKEKVVNIINKVVPKALSEVSMKDPVLWSEHGDDYDKIRDELLKQL